MKMEIYNMPKRAQEAFEQAHQQRGDRATRTRTGQTQCDYRLTPGYLRYMAAERKDRKRRAADTAERLAASAANFLMAQKRPRITACRLEFAQMKAAADKARIARARSPERQRAAMARHMNTTCYEILKQRGIV